MRRDPRRGPRRIAREHHESVEPAERATRREQRGARGLVGEIAPDGRGPGGAARVQLRDERVGPRAVAAVPDDERRAFRMEPAREDRADPAAAAREHAHTPGEGPLPAHAPSSIGSPFPKTQSSAGRQFVHVSSRVSGRVAITTTLSFGVVC